MKKIGLILANPITNYGAHLQAYATQYIVDSLGYSTQILGVSGLKTLYTTKDVGFVLYAINAMIHKISGNKSVVEYDEPFLSNVKQRTEVASSFRKRRLHDEIEYHSYGALIEAAKSLDAVLIGSDQMWLPGSSFGPINSLQFVPKGVKRLSYATSLGVEKYPKYCWKSARKMWENMDFVSVRERQGADIIKQVCNNKVNVEVVVDPTYLITKEKWEDLIQPQQMSKEKYIFCYFLGNNVDSKLCAKEYAKAHGFKLVSLLSSESLSPIDRTYADQTLGAISPEDFINWIRSAECVFTDSFHGVAFSVINQKNFYVFYRHRRDSSQSKNSRIDNIMRTWNLDEHIITNTNIDWNSNNNHSINYDRVLPILEENRRHSLSYLSTILGNNED